MTEYEKMIASQPYNCMAPELDVLRRETARRYRTSIGRKRKMNSWRCCRR